MANTAQLKAEYKEKIAPALQKQFNYTCSSTTLQRCRFLPSRRLL